MYDINENLTKNFKLREFLHNGSLEGVTPGIYENLKQLSKALEWVRIQCGRKSIHINSGFRTPEHNAEVGGAPHSQHILGKAADIIVDGLEPPQVQEILKDWGGGLGSYSTWSHVDCGTKRRWSGP